MNEAEKQKPSLEDRIGKGRLFEDFLRNDLTVECFQIQEEGLVQGLKDATSEDKAKAIWNRLRALLDVKADAQAVVEDGKLALKELERQTSYEQHGPASKPLTVKPRKGRT